MQEYDPVGMGKSVSGPSPPVHRPGQGPKVSVYLT